MKKLIIVSVLMMLLLCCVSKQTFLTASAQVESNEEIQQELTDATNSQLEALDLEKIEEYYSEFFETTDKDFKDLITEAVNGNLPISFETFSNYLKEEAYNIVLGNISLVLSLIILAFLSSLIQNFSTSKANIKSVLNIVFVVMTAILLIYTSIDCITDAVSTIKKVGKFSDAIFPVLVVLMIASGGATSGGIYQPIVATLSTSIITVFSGIVITLIVVFFVLSILNNIVNEVKLNKLISFIASLIKWVIGVVFTIFITYASLNGIMAGGKDGVSIKTAKYAIKSYVPMVGGYLSDSFEIFRAGSVILKNSIGVVGLFILIFVIIVPAIKLIILNLMLKFASGMVELAGEKTVCNLLHDVSKIFSFLLATIMAVFMMCFILFILIIMTANMV